MGLYYETIVLGGKEVEARGVENRRAVLIYSVVMASLTFDVDANKYGTLVRFIQETAGTGSRAEIKT